MAVGMLQQSRRRVVAVDQNHLEAVAVTQVTQLAGEIYIRWRQRDKMIF